MGDTSFKKVAKDAKTRFKKGYWENFKTIKLHELEKAAEEGRQTEDVVRQLTKMAREEIKENFGEPSEDDIFYKKVCEILKSNDIILNPIARLIDEGYYSNLGDSEKQAYIMQLSSRFADARQRFFDEEKN